MNRRGFLGFLTALPFMPVLKVDPIQWDFMRSVKVDSVIPFPLIFNPSDYQVNATATISNCYTLHISSASAGFAGFGQLYGNASGGCGGQAFTV